MHDPFDLSQSAHQSSPRGRLKDLGIERCLVVDPDADTRRALGLALAAAGVRDVASFPAAEAACAWLDDGNVPDLVIHAWQLAGLNGPFFLQRLRQQAPATLPVIVLHDQGDKIDQTLLEEMHVAALLAKPLAPSRLIDDLVWTLRQARRPNEPRAAERLFRQLLADGRLDDARRIEARMASDEGVHRLTQRLLAAQVAFAEGDLAKARGLAFQVVLAGRDAAPAVDLLGRSLLRLGDRVGALTCFREARRLSPLNIARACEIAQLESELGLEQDAERSLAEVIALDPGHITVIESDAALALARLDVPRATRAIATLRSHARVLTYMNNKAVALARAGRFDDGVAVYDSTLRSLGDDWSQSHDVVLYNLGLAYARYGAASEGLAVLERVRAAATSPLGARVALLKAQIANTAQSSDAAA